METRMKTILTFLVWLICLPALGAEVSVIDATGATIRLPQPAQRIVALAPHLTETLFAAGAGSQLVGTVDFSNYPEAAKTIPRVGGYSRLDLEAIVALKPDLIIAWQSGNASANIEKLRSFGFPIYVSQPNRIEDIAIVIERIGHLAGTSDVAETAAREFRTRLAALRKRYETKPTIRTFYQIWQQPLSTVSDKQIISSVIRLCGGENVFGHLETLAPVVSVEAVIAANPEAIVVSGMDESRPDWLDDWRRWSAIEAVRHDNLFFIPPDIIQRHTPRLIEGAEQFCEHLDTARDHRSK